MRTVGILTGGGDAPGLNAVIRAVVRRLAPEGYRTLGVRQGWKGLLDKSTGKGGSGQQQAAAVIELSSVDKDFHDRLQRITVRAGARSDD